jgi:hypothetical protein
MPRFYFDAPGTDANFADDTGLDMPDADAAHREAFVAVAEMLRDAAQRGRDSVAVEVRDENGRTTYTVTGRITVTRH